MQLLRYVLRRVLETIPTTVGIVLIAFALFNVVGGSAAETLLGKWCEAGEIADLAWYLTAVNRSITGEDILIDNGEMLKSNFIW